MLRFPPACSRSALQVARLSLSRRGAPETKGQWRATPGSPPRPASAAQPPPSPSRGKRAPRLLAATGAGAEPRGVGEQRLRSPPVRRPCAPRSPFPLHEAAMKKLLVAALLLVCFAALSVTAAGPNVTSAAPHSSSITTVLKQNTTTPANNVTNAMTPTAPATTVGTNISTSAHPENKTSAKPTSVKPVSPSVTTATSKATLPSASVTVTPKGAAAQVSSSGFSAGSFIGGIVLTLGLLAVGYVGCRTYHAKRGVQYRTIDEHDAII
ncbi:porimin [Podarcis raffonei]|uniref:porimin n=1 Tax=Podarcis raffonei TaxID=65483 RepID=UPI0023297EDA|nr:porimin [Podarcis raffonei]